MQNHGETVPVKSYPSSREWNQEQGTTDKAESFEQQRKKSKSSLLQRLQICVKYTQCKILLKNVVLENAWDDKLFLYWGING